jgi:hypothetical protein
VPRLAAPANLVSAPTPKPSEGQMRLGVQPRSNGPSLLDILARHRQKADGQDDEDGDESEESEEEVRPRGQEDEMSFNLTKKLRAKNSRIRQRRTSLSSMDGDHEEGLQKLIRQHQASNPKGPPKNTEDRQPTVAYNCKCVGDGVEASTTRATARFFIQAFDVDGRPQATGGDTFIVVVRGRGVVLRTRVHDQGDGHCARPAQRMRRADAHCARTRMRRRLCRVRA